MTPGARGRGGHRRCAMVPGQGTTFKVYLPRSHDGPLHLLLTEIVLPGMNGRQLAGEILKERVHVRVIYMFGYADDTVLDGAVIEPDATFIEKPFTGESLLTTIRNALA